jgi:hypothetical protein
VDLKFKVNELFGVYNLWGRNTYARKAVRGLRGHKLYIKESKISRKSSLRVCIYEFGKLTFKKCYLLGICICFYMIYFGVGNILELIHTLADLPLRISGT